MFGVFAPFFRCHRCKRRYTKIMIITRFKLKSALFHVVLAAVLAWLIEQAMLIEYIFAWFYAVNIVTFISFGLDKVSAKKDKGRTPEITYHILGLTGGFPAIFAGRRVFNHKKSKKGFIVPMWILFIAQILIAGWYFGNLDQVYHKWDKQPAAEQSQKQTQQKTAPKQTSQTKKAGS